MKYVLTSIDFIGNRYVETVEASDKASALLMFNLAYGETRMLESIVTEEEE